MYKDFFGLNRAPFELSPDPFFMFCSERSKEALASICYAISQRKGFVVMTGEVGTGKTLVLRCLFEWWRHEKIAFAYLFSPRLPVIDFLRYVASDFKIEVTEPTKGNLLRALYEFFVAQFERGLTTVLVIDEAHLMPTTVLEEIRMLTNVETNQKKLVQILLVGQPELDTKLDSFELRQLKQRIAVRCQLEPLSQEETRLYIEHRLNLAGAKVGAKPIFPAETAKAIYFYSQGIPRVINAVCEHALIAAFARQVRVVPVEIIEEAASYFRLQSTTKEKLLSLANQPEKSTPNESWQAVTDASLPAAKAVDSNRFEDPERSLLSNLRSIPVALPTERENLADSMLKAEAVCLPPDRCALSEFHTSVVVTPVDPVPPVKPLSPGQTQAFRPAAESKATQFTAPEPGIAPTAQPALDSEPISQLRQTLGPYVVRGWPIPREVLLIGAASVVALGLTIGGVMQGRQRRAVTLAHENAGTWAGETTALTEPATETSAITSNARSAVPVVPQPQSEVSTSTKAPEYLTNDPKIAIGGLSQPVLTSRQIPILSEPPPVMGTQTNELQLGNGLFDSSAPTPPRTSSGGHLQPPKLVDSPPPAYPSLARMKKVQGVVVIDALVDETGKVTEMKVISGSALLLTAAMDAVRTWKYQPARLNGQPIAFHMQVSIDFSLH